MKPQTSTSPSTFVHPEYLDFPIMRLMVYTGLVLIVMSLVGLGFLIGYLDPPNPALSAETFILRAQENQLSMLLGVTVLNVFWSFWVIWGTPFAIYIRRMERSPLLTWAWIGLTAVLSALIIMIPMSFAVMVFRVDNPAIVQAFNDLAMFLIVYSVPVFAIWMFVLGFAILRDTSTTPSLPRWSGYYTLFGGFLMAPGCLVVFFKAGPFAYNGLLGYWLVVLDFFLWMAIISVLLLKAMKRDEIELKESRA